MSTIELKEHLINKINNTTDEHILEGVLKYLEFEDDLEEVYVLSEKQKEGIEAALKQVENGQTYTNDEEIQFFEEWLKK
jgi:hypothetical protein